MNPAWRSRYDAALAAAAQAGRHALSYFDRDVAVEWKNDRSPVTVADREAEQMLRAALLEHFPDDGFLGEEFGDKPGTTGFRWIVDPIDGTRSFIRNIPIWATLVGLTYQGEAIAGVCFAPALGQTYRALRGDGAYRNDRRLHVSTIADLNKSMLFYTSLSWFQRAGKSAEFLQLTMRTQAQRGHGDFYGTMLVAQGSGELMVEHGVHVWDVAALQPIVEEAGGRFSTWDGNVNLDRPDVLATNGVLHDQALAILNNRAEC